MKAHQGKRELRWTRSRSCLVTFIEAKVVHDGLWQEWLEEVTSPKTKTLVWCTEGAVKLSPAQWRELTSALKERGAIVSLITDDRQCAAQAKKAAWLGAKITAFRWNEHLYDALVNLELGSNASEARRDIKAQALALRDYYGAKGDSHGAKGGSAAGSSTPERKMPAWMSEPSTPDSRPRSRAMSSSASSVNSAPAAARSNGSAVRANGSAGSAARSNGSAARSNGSAVRSPGVSASAPERPKRGALTAEFERSRDAVFRSSSDIQAKLAEVQARLRARNLEMQRARN